MLYTIVENHYSDEPRQLNIRLKGWHNQTDNVVVWARVNDEPFRAVQPIYYAYDSSLEKFINKFQLTRREVHEDHYIDFKDNMVKEFGSIGSIDKKMVRNGYCQNDGCTTLEGFRFNYNDYKL